METIRDKLPYVPTTQHTNPTVCTLICLSSCENGGKIFNTCIFIHTHTYMHAHTRVYTHAHTLSCCLISAVFLPLHHPFLLHIKSSNEHMVPSTASWVCCFSKQHFSNTYLLYTLFVHIVTSCSFYVHFDLDLIFSTPLKISLSWNTSFFNFLDTRFPVGSAYFFGLLFFNLFFFSNNPLLPYSFWILESHRICLDHLSSSVFSC